jgi:predicted DNA-binding transcriptional regulator YafY
VNDLINSPERKVVEIDFTNWKGKRRVRQIRPICLEIWDSGFHANNYCVRAVDLEEAEYTERSFTIKDIHSWRELP